MSSDDGKEDAPSHSPASVWLPATDHEGERRSLGLSLRRWRRAAGLSGSLVAARAGISQAKLSNLETGKTLPTGEDVAQLGSTLGLTDAQVAGMRDRVSALHAQARSLRGLSGPDYEHLQASVKERQSRARSIALYSTTLIPGLLQSAVYAGAVFQRVPGLGREFVASATAARLDRQSVLYDPARRFEFVINECALRRRIVRAAEFRAQADRILSLAGLPNVTVAVVPVSAWFDFQPPFHSFQIYDDELITVEMLTAEVALRDPSDVASYRKLFDNLKGVSVSGPELAALLGEVARDYEALESNLAQA